MEGRAVSNTGPILHLSEIDLVKVFKIFKEVAIPMEVKEELIKNKVDVNKIKKIKVISLQSKFKNISAVFIGRFSLDLGEAQAIALALQEKSDYFLTDDLDARLVALDYGVEVHGTAGIILRAFRNEIMRKEEAIEKIRALHSMSSLFITKNLTDYIVEEIERFSKRK